MSVEATSEAKAKDAAIEAAAATADLSDAFRLAVAEAVNRLLSITAQERASNTDFERAARTALTFLKAAAEALTISAAKRKDDAEHDRGDKPSLPSDEQLERFERLLFRRMARRVGDAESPDAAPVQPRAGADAGAAA